MKCSVSCSVISLWLMAFHHHGEAAQLPMPQQQQQQQQQLALLQQADPFDEVPAKLGEMEENRGSGMRNMQHEHRHRDHRILAHSGDSPRHLQKEIERMAARADRLSATDHAAAARLAGSLEEVEVGLAAQADGDSELSEEIRVVRANLCTKLNPHGKQFADCEAFMKKTCALPSAPLGLCQLFFQVKQAENGDDDKDAGDGDKKDKPDEEKEDEEEETEEKKEKEDEEEDKKEKKEEKEEDDKKEEKEGEEKKQEKEDKKEKDDKEDDKKETKDNEEATEEKKEKKEQKEKEGKEVDAKGESDRKKDEKEDGENGDKNNKTSQHGSEQDEEQAGSVPEWWSKKNRHLPEQGYSGDPVEQDVAHMTGDWQREFGPRSGHRGYTTICRDHPDNEWCKIHMWSDAPAGVGKKSFSSSDAPAGEGKKSFSSSDAAAGEGKKSFSSSDKFHSGLSEPDTTTTTRSGARGVHRQALKAVVAVSLLALLF